MGELAPRPACRDCGAPIDLTLSFHDDLPAGKVECRRCRAIHDVHEVVPR